MVICFLTCFWTVARVFYAVVIQLLQCFGMVFSMFMNCYGLGSFSVRKMPFYRLPGEKKVRLL